MIKPPEQPKNSFRVILNLATSQRIDAVLLAQLRSQDKSPELKAISRKSFKELFKTRRIQLKGQSAVPSSFLAAGVSYVDILGFGEQVAQTPSLEAPSLEAPSLEGPAPESSDEPDSAL